MGVMMPDGTQAGLSLLFAREGKINSKDQS